MQRIKSEEKRLSISFIMIIVMFVVSGSFTFYGLVQLGNLTRVIYEHPLVVSNASLKAALSVSKMQTRMKDFVLKESAEERVLCIEKMAKHEAALLLELDLVKENILGDQGKRLEAETRQLVMDWQPIRRRVLKMTDEGKKNEAIQLTQNEGAAHVAQLDAKLHELMRYARKKADGFQSLAEERQKTYEHVTVALTLAAIFLSLGIVYFAVRHVKHVRERLVEEHRNLRLAMDEIHTLQGIIPICSNCKQIRNDEGSWTLVEEYIQAHSDASFSHGICPDCLRKLYPEYVETIERTPEDKR